MTVQKSEIRRTVKDLKRKIDGAGKHKCEEAVISFLLQCRTISECRNILLYHALPDELPTSRMIQTFMADKHVFLPRVEGDDLAIVEFKGDNLQEGAFGIYEPAGEPVGIENMDAVIVPGVAFDRLGNRLGRGKGYYDRLLRNFCHTKIGVAFSCQIVDTVPHEPHDIKMDMIITEKEIISPQKA